jgi:hypothetical protein
MDGFAIRSPVCAVVISSQDHRVSKLPRPIALCAPIGLCQLKKGARVTLTSLERLRQNYSHRKYVDGEKSFCAADGVCATISNILLCHVTRSDHR